MRTNIHIFQLLECELLRIDKETFDKVLLSVKASEWKERLNFMRQLPAFEDLSFEDLKQLNEAASFENHTDGKVGMHCTLFAFH